MLKIIPTPTATPIKAQEATAPAINLNPINNNDMKFDTKYNNRTVLKNIQRYRSKRY